MHFSKYSCACGGGWQEEKKEADSLGMTYGRKYNTDMDLKEVERKQMLQSRNSTYQCEGSLANIAGWTNMEGQDCSAIYQEQLINDTLCSAQYYNAGYTENTACCYCPNGGIDLERAVFKEAVNEQCRDRAGWNILFRNNLITCDRFKEVQDLCLGNVALLVDSSNGLTAKDACCICGGGYSGYLMGKTFRAQFISNTESFHQMFAYSNGTTIDGSIFELMNLVSSTYGFGLYETDNPYEPSGTSGSNAKNDCVGAITNNQLDLCIGKL